MAENRTFTVLKGCFKTGRQNIQVTSMRNIPTFNLKGLAGIYVEAEQRDGKYTVFEIVIGKGHFLCMMFLSEDDGGNKDTLFVYLRHLRELLQIKTYGNHHRGDFMIYLNDYEKRKLTDELQLKPGGGDFAFDKFLHEFNQKIPQSIHRDTVVKKLRENKNYIPPGVIDEADKTVLVSLRRLLPHQHPQDKTLRKLYIFTDGDTNTITRLIGRLKATNCTVCWTTEENRNQARTISYLLNLINIFIVIINYGCKFVTL
ncbi:MAG: hypothetical protein IJ587_00985 [Synergistaceae bacterium]|nr:hypothetical protein [Synergistaceae bacterium]